jgi:molybdopterin/thiamine biosynthesis adenylyltransferase
VSYVVVVGAGTIGSHVLPHLARMRGVTTVAIIDRDRYELANVAAQNIRPADVGRSKAQIQARRLKQINRALETRAVHAPVEEVPLGCLRADVILACLDSRRARMTVNQAASRLRVPWVDAGIDAGGLLARVQVFIPSDGAPCLECAWDDTDYALVEQSYPCQHGDAPPATGASSSLGALAASLQAIECEKLLSTDRGHSLVGRNVMIDVLHHRHYVTTFQRNSECRMPDHPGWQIRRCNMDPTTTTLEELTATASVLFGSTDSVRLGVARSVAGFEAGEMVALETLPSAARNRPLAELGLLPGDVLTLATSDHEEHLELIGES